MFKSASLLLLALSFSACAGLKSTSEYPIHWWNKVPDSQRRGSWEILPHEAESGEVILSKRNELGLFSNFAATPIEFEGDKYASIEGLWQMMKYPDPKNSKDPRLKYSTQYPHTRDEVKALDGFVAKKAGDAAKKVSKKYGFNWVTYKAKKFNYKDHAAGSAIHLKIMENAILAKIMQNKDVKSLLIKTKGLILRPDHSQGSNPPPSYLYHEILMRIRKKL
ncbi:MAG: putative NAD-dependent protein-ADP-ribosyltransferase YbiA (DUF1768 family) [Thermoproteota archaeon]|jgi:predicted NAD-dependent protein-ADP-ribosyltransferase YbiA (DUF1768 family)